MNWGGSKRLIPMRTMVVRYIAVVMLDTKTTKYPKVSNEKSLAPAINEPKTINATLATHILSINQPNQQLQFTGKQTTWSSLQTTYRGLVIYVLVNEYAYLPRIWRVYLCLAKMYSSIMVNTTVVLLKVVYIGTLTPRIDSIVASFQRTMTMGEVSTFLERKKKEKEC